MSLSSQQAENDEDIAFTARLDSVKTLTTLLKSINFLDNCICFLTERGLKVTVEDSKCVQMNAFIQAEVFEEYILHAEQIIIKVDLTVLIECLSIFGSQHTALKMCYQGYGYPLTLLLEENGVITDCSIKTQEPEDMLDFNFSSENAINKVILRSDYFREVLNELDATSDFVDILLSPEPPFFRITTEGVAGETKIEIPKDSDVIESFCCSTVATCRYKYSHLKSSFKALTVSQKVSIRTDDRGILCFQYMVPADKNICFIEYYATPVVDCDDA